MNNYSFIRLNFKYLFFGFILTFCSSFGQTFFIGIFNPFFRETKHFDKNPHQTRTYHLREQFVLTIVIVVAPTVTDHPLYGEDRPEEIKNFIQIKKKKR